VRLAFWGNSVRGRMTAIIVLTVLVLLGASTYITYTQFRNVTETSAFDAAARGAENNAMIVNNWLEAKGNQLSALADTSDMKYMIWEIQIPVLKRLAENQPDFEMFYVIESDGLTIDLMLKGGGCENVGRQYSLPETNLNAGRDLKGVRKVVLDAVHQAQGQGCSPGFLGVAIGGDRSSSYLVSKEALLRSPGDTNPNPELQALEEQITQDANELGIGPMGFGGKSTVLGTKIKAAYRLPASYFVTISYMCWAYRHRTMTIKGNEVTYK